MSVNNSTNRYACSNFIVAPTIAEGANYTTIASALADASSGDVIFIKPGTYTENITGVAGVHLTTFNTTDIGTSAVIIDGKVTFTATGTFTISNISLQTNSDYFLELSGSNAPLVNLDKCFLNCTNNTGINCSSSTSSTVYINNCRGDIGTTGISLFVSTATAGAIEIRNSIMNNSGSSTTSSTTNAISINTYSSQLFFPITTSSTGFGVVFNSNITNTATNTTCLTLAGTGNFQIFNSQFFSGTASAISIGSGTTCTVLNSQIFSSNANVITGAGTLNKSAISFGSGTTLNPTTDNNLGISELYAPSGLTFDNTNIMSNFVDTTSWTPTIVGDSAAGVGTYTQQLGRYSRVGNIVFLTFAMTWSAHTGTGNMRIGGIPVAPITTAIRPCGTVQWGSATTLPANRLWGQVLVAGDASTTQFFLQFTNTSGNVDNIAIDTAASVNGSIWYFV